MPKYFIPAEQTKVMTMKDKGLRVIFDTQEPTETEASDIMKLAHKAGVLFFTDNEMEKVPEVPPVPKVEGKKSASLRLRNELFWEWDESYANLMTSEEHYQKRMEEIILEVRGKRPEPFKEE